MVNYEEALTARDNVQASGDVIDASQDDRHVVAVMGITGISVGTFIEWATISQSLSPNLTMNLAEFGVAVVANAYLLNNSGQWFKRSLEQPGASQAVLREYFGRLPVDVVQTKTGPVLDIFPKRGSADAAPEDLTTSELRGSAHRAGALGIEQVLVSTTESVTGHVDTEKIVTAKAWYRNHKMYAPLFKPDRKVVALSPPEMLSLAEAMDAQTPDEQQKYIDILRASGRSRVPELFDMAATAADVEAAQKHIRQTLRHEFEVASQDVSLERGFNRLTGVQTIDKVHSSTQIVGDNVLSLTTPEVPTGKIIANYESLFSAVQVGSQSELYKVLDDVKDITDVTVQRARVALLLTLKEIVDKPPSETEWQASTLQTAIATGMKLETSTASDTRKAVKAVAVLITAILATVMPLRAANTQGEAAYKVYAKQYSGLTADEKTRTSLDDFIALSNKSDAVLASGYSHTKELADLVHGLPDPLMNLVDKVSGTKSKGLGLGNTLVNQHGDSSPIGDAPWSEHPKTAYTIESFNGANSQGYWGEKVRDTIVIKDNAPDIANALELSSNNYPGQGSDVEYPGLPQVPTDEQLHHDPLLRVRADIAYPSTNYSVANNHIVTNEGYVGMAVKQGYQPIAGRLVVQNPNGGTGYANITKFIRSAQGEWSYSIGENTKSSKVELISVEYWLGKSSVYNLGMLAAGPMFVHYPRPTPTTMDISLADGIETRSVLGKDFGRAIESKLYSLTPIADSGMDTFIQPGAKLDSIVAKLARMPAAVCNTASLEYVVASGPTDAEGHAIKIANGFLDDGDGTLDSNELHAWVVNSRGRITDVTPSLSATDTAQDEGTITADMLRNGFALTALGAAMLGLYRQRRQLSAFAGRRLDTVAQVAGKQLTQHPQAADAALAGRMVAAYFDRPGASAVPMGPHEVAPNLTNTVPAASYREHRKVLGKLSVSDKLRLARLSLAQRHLAAHRIAE